MIGSRVRQVRELLGLTQTELSTATGIRQSRISSIEVGTPAQPNELEVLSRATGFGVGWFLREADAELPDGTIRFRKSSRASKRDDRRAVRRLEVASELVNELSTGLRLPSVSLASIAVDGSSES